MCLEVADRDAPQSAQEQWLTGLVFFSEHISVYSLYTFNCLPWALSVLRGENCQKEQK